MNPTRIQLSRRRGYRKPEGAIVVARPTKWGNPFTIRGAIENGFASKDDSPAELRRYVAACFRDWMLHGHDSVWWYEAGASRWAWMWAHLSELRGHDLACWCPLGSDQSCHADVLLELANR